MEPSTFLRLMWLASPGLPVGGFSYSEGLEAAIDAGHVHDERTARDWLLDQQALTLGRGELPLLVQAVVAWESDDLPRAAALNQWLLHTRESAELKRQCEQMGRSLTDWLRQRHRDDARVATLAAFSPAPGWTVAFALAAAAAGAVRSETRAALLAYGFGWAENQVQAVVKALPLGQSAGQRLLEAMAAELPPLVDAALAFDDDARQSFTPMLAILSARHETQYTRLFRS